jgi:hypothetical protein
VRPPSPTSWPPETWPFAGSSPETLGFVDDFGETRVPVGFLDSTKRKRPSWIGGEIPLVACFGEWASSGGSAVMVGLRETGPGLGERVIYKSFGGFAGLVRVFCFCHTLTHISVAGYRLER